jgi:hypothetical protein
VVHSPLGPWVTWQHWSSPLREARPGPRDSAGAHLDRKARSGAEEHVIASELSSQGGRARCHETRGSAGTHFGRDARFRAEELVAPPELNSARRQGPGHRPRGSTGAHLLTRGGSGAHLCMEVWPEAIACVATC